MRFCENFCEANREAALKRMLSQNQRSSLLVCMPASCYPMRDCAVFGVTFLGPSRAALSWCTRPGMIVYQEPSWSMSNWKRFSIPSEQFLCNGVRVSLSCKWIDISNSHSLKLGMLSKHWIIVKSGEWAIGQCFSQARLPFVAKNMDCFLVSAEPANRGFSEANIKLVRILVRVCSHWFCSKRISIAWRSLELWKNRWYIFVPRCFS